MIKLENITKEFFIRDKNGKRTLSVLRGIDLEIADGDYVSIQGRSGEGKSTLLNIIGLLDSPTSGEYYYCGQPLYKQKSGDFSELRKRDFGFIFQAYHLLGDLTARQNIELPFVYYDEKPDKYELDGICEQLKIDSLLDNPVKNLSGGEKQRVAIARAMITNPKIVLCDEPTGNLDNENTKAVLEAFDVMKKQGKTLVLVTHNVSVAEKADKHYVLREGRIERHEKIS